MLKLKLLFIVNKSIKKENKIMNNKEWKKWLFWFTFAVSAIIVYKTIDSVSVIVTGIVNFFNLIILMVYIE